MIFITCAIVSLVPIALASGIVVYARTFSDIDTIAGLSTFGAGLLYMTPAIVFLMGDYLFYKTALKNQTMSSTEKGQVLLGFYLAFVTLYVTYFFTIDMVAGLFHMLGKIS